MEADKEEKRIITKLIGHAGFDRERYMFVMKCLADSRKDRTRIGRRKISELAHEKELFLSENEIRGILNVLKKYGLVSLSNGRGGTQLTTLGARVYDGM